MNRNGLTLVISKARLADARWVLFQYVIAQDIFNQYTHIFDLLLLSTTAVGLKHYFSRTFLFYINYVQYHERQYAQNESVFGTELLTNATE